MKCGMKATIIRYKSAIDIDIQFEDGTVRTNQCYSNFTTGLIKNPNIQAGERIGLTKLMRCGMCATIIAYRKSDDIDVRFENGEIATQKRFENFQDGAIAYPSLMNTKDRLGETRMMNCGMNATIIEYRNCDDIDVRFEDGTVVCNRQYGSFKIGQISNPTIYVSRYASRLHETKRMNCGMSAEIIAYRKSNDIDVQFEDGTIVKHRRYTDFTKLIIGNPNLRKNLVHKIYYTVTPILYN